VISPAMMIAVDVRSGGTGPRLMILDQ